MKLLSLSKLSLQTRMIVGLGTVVLVGLAGLTAWSVNASYSAGVDNARRLAKVMAQRSAEQVTIEFADAFAAARGMAEAADFLLKSEKPDREVLSQMMRLRCERSTRILATWAVFEPNAFDGRDQEFAGKEGFDPAGRVNVYWHRDSSGTVVSEITADYETAGAGDYYLVPRERQKETVLEPYFYEVSGKKVLMTSVAVPLLRDGRVMGVIGVDVTIDDLSARMLTLQKDVPGYVAIVSSAGNYVAHPTEGRRGQPMITSDPWAQPFLPAIAEGKEFLAETFSQTLGTKVYRASAPVVLGDTATPWAALLTLREDAMLEAARDTRNKLLIGSFVVLMVVLATVAWIARGITLPVQRFAEMLGEYAANVGASAANVSSISQNLAAGASQQAASLEESSASLEELSSMTKRNAESAGRANDLTRQARNSADQGSSDMQAMAQAMADINGSSDEIAKIIKTIDEIAFQTNILALNAAVEAARAGEMGAGFAIVAGEVRNLAQRSAHSARETAAKIDAAIAKTAQGVAICNKVQDGLQTIVAHVRSVDAVVSEVSLASREQSTGLGQVTTAVVEMDKITQSNAACAEETAGAAQELNAQAVSLQQVVRELNAMVGTNPGLADPKTEARSHPLPAAVRAPISTRR